MTLPSPIVYTRSGPSFAVYCNEGTQEGRTVGSEVGKMVERMEGSEVGLSLIHI